MERKTSNSYQKEVLEKYRKEKGGELSTYLLKPTAKLIKQACIFLLDKRSSIDDINILNCFFQFRNVESRLREVKNFDNDRFKPIVYFLKGKTNSTSDEYIELIALLIDFKPRPLRQYLKSDNLISEEEPERTEPEIIDELNGDDEIKQKERERRRLEEEKKELERKKREEARGKEEKKRRRRIITISISLGFGITMLILGIQYWPLNILNNSSKEVECMTWADSLYIPISCDESPLSKYGTQVKPLDPMELKNMRKVEVVNGYPFFSADGKPLVWYYKNEDNEHEYFTAPGYHPVTEETLRKITPYIIKTYVPIHQDKKQSFVAE